MSNIVTTSNFGQAPQAGVHLDTDMVAHCLSDAKISLFNKALGKYIAPFKIKPNHDPLQVAYCLHQMEVAVHSAAVAADIPARMLDSVEIQRAHNSILDLPVGSDGRIPTEADIGRLFERMQDSKSIKSVTRNSYLTALTADRSDPERYQANIGILESKVNQADAAYEDDCDVYFRAKERKTDGMKIINFLNSVKSLTNNAFTQIKLSFPDSYLQGLNPLISGHQKRGPRNDLPVTLDRSKIDPILLCDFLTFRRHAELLVEIQKHMGFSTAQQKDEFRNQLLTNSDYVMKSDHTVRDFNNTLLFPRVKLLAQSPAHAITELQLLRHLVNKCYDLPRFAYLQSQYRSKLNHDSDYIASINSEELHRVILAYEEEDAAYWKRQTTKPVDIESNLTSLEVNTVWPGKPKNPTQNKRNAPRGGNQNPTGSQKPTGAPNKTFQVKCHWCGGPHFDSACADKAAGKKQTKAGITAALETATRQEAKKAARAAKRSPDDASAGGNSNRKKSKLVASVSDAMVDIEEEDGEVNLVELLLEVCSLDPIKSARSVIPETVPIDSGAQVTTLSAESKHLTNKRSTDLTLSFGNNTTSKVECVGDLGEMKGVMVNRNTKTLISLPKLCTENRVPVVCTSDKMYLLRPDSKVTFKQSSILLEAPLQDGLYRANFMDLISKVGKVDVSK